MRLLQNLISNSIKYRSADAPRIHLSVREAGAEWVFSIKDNGIGLDMRHAEHIFTVFKRLHGRDYPGTGIGLAICKRIVERHGGRIWVESEPGKGSTILLLIARFRETELTRRYLPSSMIRIVVVEDNPSDAQMLRQALERSGIPTEVTFLDDGAKALEYLDGPAGHARPRQFDILLLDLNLPVVSGFEVLEHIRASEDLKSLPVIVMSGSSDPREVERCYRTGANSYICKPTHLQEIFSTVAQMVAYWSTVMLPSTSRVARAGKVAAIGLPNS